MHTFVAWLNTASEADRLVGFCSDLSLDAQAKDQGGYHKVTCDSVDDLQQYKIAQHFARYRRCTIDWD